MKIDFKFDIIVDKIKKLDPKYRYVIFGAALAVVFLLNYLIFLHPIMSSLSALSVKTSELRQNLQNVKNDIARIDQNRAQLDKIRAQINEVKIKIRTKQEVPLILEDISKAASQNGVKIDQLMPLKDQQEVLAKSENVKYYSLPVLIQARSGYHDLGYFLAKLEDDKTFYSMANLSITANPKATTNQLVQLTVKAVISEPYDPKTEKKDDKAKAKK